MSDLSGVAGGVFVVSGAAGDIERRVYI